MSLDPAIIVPARKAAYLADVNLDTEDVDVVEAERNKSIGAGAKAALWQIQRENLDVIEEYQQMDEVFDTIDGLTEEQRLTLSEYLG